MSIIINDKLSYNDSAILNLEDAGMHRKTFRTQVICGTDPWVDSKTGITYLGEVWDEEENETVIYGSIYTLMKLFNNTSPLSVSTINEILGVNVTGPTMDTTNGLPTLHAVNLFGVGIGGAGESSYDSYEVDFKARELNQMIPLRFTADELSELEKSQYYMKRTIPATDTEPERKAYYLKEFDSKEIKVLWRDAEEGEDGTEVEDGVHASSNTNPIDVFEQLILKISKKDIKEYFEYNGNLNLARINEIGLFTGIKQTLATGEIDYRYVNLFSAVHINNEMLKYSKDLTIIYRIYTN